MLLERNSIIQRGDFTKINFESTGDFRDTIKWLENAAKQDLNSPLHLIGKDGVKSLSASTPVGDTGETAGGWEYIIEHTPSGLELSFVNNAHPEAEVNVAKVIDSGHATGTGGYVAPRPYIRQTIDTVLKRNSNMLTEEMMK